MNDYKPAAQKIEGYPVPVFLPDGTDTVACDICMDFDGVLHAYTSGWHGASVIPDPPVPGALATLYRYLREFSVAIHSARSAQPGGIIAMKKWLDSHDQTHRDKALKYEISVSRAQYQSIEAGRLVDRIAFPLHKPAAKIYYDDRGVRFNGKFLNSRALQKLMSPWNQTTEDV